MMEGIALLRLALAVLADKVLTIIALSMSFGLACWTMWWPTYERLGMSAFFALFSYLMVKTKEKHDARSEGT
jgi:hypothetical protein